MGVCVQSTKVAAHVAPALPRLARLKVEIAQCLTRHALHDQVRHRQEVTRFVVGDQRRRTNAGRPGGRDGNRLGARLPDVSRVIAGDSKYQVLAQQVDAVDDPRVGES